ncbi:MAG: hypothetical protein ACOYI4_09275 [Christensenellales bacterium]|jgi:hypothetical protein|nr:hypothetical protein [Negativicutes bacterium]
MTDLQKQNIRNWIDDFIESNRKESTTASGELSAAFSFKRTAETLEELKQVLIRNGLDLWEK